MDACMGYLAQVDMLMQGYREIPMYEDVFEAGDPEIAEQSAKNTQIEDKSMSLLKKASAAIRHILDKISGIIGNIKEWFNTSDSEKSEYKKFLKECKENKEFAGMKVTLHDYREIVNRYETTLSNAEKEYRGIKDTEKEEEPSFMRALGGDLEKLKDQAVELAKKAGKIITVEAALKFAKSSQENAAKVDMMLALDRRFLGALEKEIEKKDLKKFRRKIKMLKSKHAFLRKIAGGRQEQAMLIRDALQETIGSIRGASKIAVKTLGKRKSAKLVAQAGVGAAKTYVGAKHDAKKMYKNEKDYARSVMKNQLSHEDNTYERIERKEERKRARAAKKAAKKAAKQDDDM